MRRDERRGREEGREGRGRKEESEEEARAPFGWEQLGEREQ